MLLNLFNMIWTQRIFPQEWRNYQVFFIDKVGKEKVRPIALSSCVGKLMERLVNESLVWLEKNTKLYSMQNGFRRGRSCMENLAKMISDVRSANLAGDYTLAAYLNVSSAYDNVDFEIMIDKVKSVGCLSGIGKYLECWLKPRTTSFILNNQIEEIRTVYKGLPQGAVLSPILYALYTNKLTNRIDKMVPIVQFADDVALYVQGLNRMDNKCNLEVAVDRIANLESLKLNLAPQKTNLVEFSKSGFCDKRLHIKVRKVKIFNRQSAKFLGIWMDNKLNFSKHVTDIRGRVNKANNIMKYLSNISRGIEVNMSLLLYKSMVRSIMDYGIHIYSPKLKSLQIKLERGQFLGIRTALGYRNSTPTNILIAKSKILLRDRALMLAKNFCSKVYKYGEQSLINSLNNLKNKEMFARFKNPSINKSVLCEAWDYIIRTQNRIGKKEGNFEVWKLDYKTITYKIDVDYEISKCIKEKGK